MSGSAALTGPSLVERLLAVISGEVSDAYEVADIVKAGNAVVRAGGDGLSPSIETMVMKTSAGFDYFVSISVGERNVTPYMFKERYKADYHVALFEWLLNGGPEPDVLEYGPERDAAAEGGAA